MPRIGVAEIKQGLIGLERDFHDQDLALSEFLTRGRNNALQILGAAERMLAGFEKQLAEIEAQ